MRRGTSLPLDWHQPPLHDGDFVANLVLSGLSCLGWLTLGFALNVLGLGVHLIPVSSSVWAVPLGSLTLIGRGHHKMAGPALHRRSVYSTLTISTPSG